MQSNFFPKPWIFKFRILPSNDLSTGFLAPEMTIVILTQIILPCFNGNFKDTEIVFDVSEYSMRFNWSHSLPNEINGRRKYVNDTLFPFYYLDVFIRFVYVRRLSTV